MTYHSYATYDAMLTGRCSQRRKLANNTYAERRPGGVIAIRLHATDIIEYHPDGAIALDTGGWLTVTTKERMNRFAPARLWSEKGRWWVRWDGHDPVLYADGITLEADGSMTGVPSDSKVAAQDARNRKTRAKIKRFVDSITPERIIAAWENSGGDCLICKVNLHDDRMADFGGGCLSEHLREGYFHASLAYRAIRAQGYRDPGVIMSMVYNDAVYRHEVDNLLTRALTKYLRANLLEGVATPGKKGQAA